MQPYIQAYKPHPFLPGNLYKDGVKRTKKCLSYSTFGATMPELTFTSSTAYRFGFNGKEGDNEIKGSGNSYDFGARIYDPRLGRWFSTDPLQAKYPNLSPYHFCADNPIVYVDEDGKDYRYSVEINKSNTVADKVVIETRIHLYGPDASSVDRQPYEITMQVMRKVFDAEQRQWVDKPVFVTVKVTFALAESKEKAIEAMKANPGDNVMQVNTSLDNLQMTDFGGGPAKEGVRDANLDRTIIGGSSEGLSSNVRTTERAIIIHSVMHQIGFRDRYTEEGNYLIPHIGYAGTIMSGVYKSGILNVPLAITNIMDIAMQAMNEAGNKSTPKTNAYEYDKKVHMGPFPETPSSPIPPGNVAGDTNPVAPQLQR